MAQNRERQRGERCSNFLSVIKNGKAEALPPVFLIKPPSVTLEKFGEWVCACRSSSAFFRRSAALWLRQRLTQKNNCRSSHPPVFSADFTAVCRNKGCINVKIQSVLYTKFDHLSIKKNLVLINSYFHLYNRKDRFLRESCKKF